jgi:hypothetical protein
MQERPYAGLADASPASSLQTMILARRVEHAFNAAVDRLHDTDPRE